MKLEAQFKNKNGKLFSIKTGNEINTDSLIKVDAVSGKIPEPAFSEFVERTADRDTVLLGICIAWSVIEISEGIYNEEFLAELRDFLKKIEQQGIYAVIIPETNGTVTGRSFASYTAAMVHTARRIKDCESVAGFALPAELAGDDSAVSSFIDEMAVKHAHYVYFSPEKTHSGQLISYQMR
ncbi:MAG: hypothetical protein M0P01_04225 [Treponema sp.]|nr:hypothetical protein [Treponema sp.]